MSAVGTDDFTVPSCTVRCRTCLAFKNKKFR